MTGTDIYISAGREGLDFESYHCANEHSKVMKRADRAVVIQTTKVRKPHPIFHLQAVIAVELRSPITDIIQSENSKRQTTAKRNR